MISPADRGGYGCGGRDPTGGVPQEVLEQVIILHGHPTNLGSISVVSINSGVNFRAAVINSNLSVSPRNIIIHTTYQPHNMRVYNHE